MKTIVNSIKDTVNSLSYHPEWILILLILLISVFGMFGSLQLGAIECKETAKVMGVEYKWSRWTGCMIEIEPDKWIPLDSYYYKEE